MAKSAEPAGSPCWTPSEEQKGAAWAVQVLVGLSDQDGVSKLADGTESGLGLGGVSVADARPLDLVRNVGVHVGEGRAVLEVSAVG